MSNFVVVRHAYESGRYLFLVPEDVTLDPGTAVICETKRSSHEPGVCITGTFKADPEVICPLWGTQPKAMKRVIKVLREFALEWPERTEPVEEEEDD